MHRLAIAILSAAAAAAGCSIFEEPTSSPTAPTRTSPTTTSTAAPPSYDGLWNVTVTIDRCSRITHTASMSVLNGSFGTRLFTYCADPRTGSTRIDTGGGCGSDTRQTVDISGSMSGSRVSGNLTLTGTSCNGANGFSGAMTSPSAGAGTGFWGDVTFVKR
jgi:hypothetical protein